MRNTDTIEVKSIRERRTLMGRCLIAMFPKTFYHFAWAHLSRAQQQGIISNDANHDIVHYVAKDCGM
jgi:hypothetical protein